MEECNRMTSWDEKCKNECESVRVFEQIREMCSWRNRCDMILFNKEECSTIIEFYVQVKKIKKSFVLNVHVCCE